MLEVDQLPDDPAVLKRVLIEQVAEYDAQLVERDAQLAERDARIERIRQEAAGQMEALRQRMEAEKKAEIEAAVKAILKRYYGPRSERFDPTQLLLFGLKVEETPIDEQAVAEEAGEELVTRRVAKRHKHGRRPLPDHLPRIEILHDLKDDEKPCPCCGELRHRIGEEVSEQLEYMPASFKVLKHVRVKYACGRCEHDGYNPQIVAAAKPPQPIEKGLPGPGLLAYVAVSKLGDHLPLYRLSDAVTCRFGNKLLDKIKVLFRLWHRRKTSPQERWRRHVLCVQQEILQTVRRAPLRIEAQNLAQRFRDHGPYYFTFLERSGVEPTNKDVCVADVKMEDVATLMGRVKQQVDSSPEKEAFVFIHGFNVTFDDAAMRTAQIAYDLDFHGAPIFYSWPSQGTVLYSWDSDAWPTAIPHFKEFLKSVAKNTGAKHIHLIAHSMGNRLLTSVLTDLPKDIGADVARNLFHEIVLAAPDINEDVFESQIAPALVTQYARVTLYASSNDEALRLSHSFNHSLRAGDCEGGQICVFKGMDSIDVSALDTAMDGHSYVASNSVVLCDLYYLLKEGKPAAERFRLRPHLYNGLPYYAFTP